MLHRIMQLKLEIMHVVLRLVQRVEEAGPLILELLDAPLQRHV